MMDIEMVVSLFILHVMALIGVFAIKNISTNTIILQVVMYILGMLGLTAGYHRLWTHNSYEASSLLEWFLMLCGSSASQKDAIWWVRNHRTHHRNEDELADPYSIRRGFFYAHMGWLLNHPDEITQDEIDKSDVSDLEANPILQFQKQNYTTLLLITSIAVPVLLASTWNDAYNSFWASLIRIVILLHATYSVNSFAHMGDDKPYDESLRAAESGLVSLITHGEGWHNYHHSYPKDFYASEAGKYNPTAWFILAAHMLGQASDLHRKCKPINKNDKFNKSMYCKME